MLGELEENTLLEYFVAFAIITVSNAYVLTERTRFEIAKKMFN
jgi:hypothetical protein